MSSVPAFTVLDDAIGMDESDLDFGAPKSTWEDMYQSNVLSAPPNSPFSNYNVPHMPPDYESLSHSSRTPSIPQSYNDSLAHNSFVERKLRQFHMPSIPPTPLPQKINLPTLIPPYGTSYPTNQYSAFDGEYALDAGVQSFYNVPGVPIASVPALQDARYAPSQAMGPTSTVVVENSFREGFNAGQKNYTPSCVDMIGHIQGCPMCSNYLKGDSRLYTVVIGFLLIIILILLFFLLRRSGIRSANIK